MTRTRDKLFAARGGILPILLCTLGLFGCRTGPLADYYGINPFYRQGPEEQEYGPAPAERRQQVQQLAARSRNLPPAEQIAVAADLALQLQNEVDPIVRAEVARTLGKFNTESAREALRMAMHDGEASVRIAACRAWREIGGPDAIAALSEILASDTNNDVRLAATAALGAFEDPAALRGLAVALDDSSPAIQYRAMESLKNASGRDLGHDVVAWREFIETTSAAPGPRSGPSLVERMRDRF